MLHAQRQTFESDPETDTNVISDVMAAYHSGLQQKLFLGIWTKSTLLAYARGCSALSGRLDIDFPVDAPPLTSQSLVYA